MGLWVVEMQHILTPDPIGSCVLVCIGQEYLPFFITLLYNAALKLEVGWTVLDSWVVQELLSVSGLLR
jgi:hypothetical protein